MPAAISRLVGDRWCDIQGARIALFAGWSRLTRLLSPGHCPARLGQRGEVVGRGLESLFVRFADHAVLSVPPRMLRLLSDTTAGEC
jgi:hypothetical protein